MALGLSPFDMVGVIGSSPIAPTKLLSRTRGAGLTPRIGTHAERRSVRGGNKRNDVEPGPGYDAAKQHVISIPFLVALVFMVPMKSAAWPHFFILR